MKLWKFALSIVTLGIGLLDYVLQTNLIPGALFTLMGALGTVWFWPFWPFKDIEKKGEQE